MNHSACGPRGAALRRLTGGAAEGTAAPCRVCLEPGCRVALGAPRPRSVESPSLGYSAQFLINRVSSLLKTHPLITLALDLLLCFHGSARGIRLWFGMGRGVGGRKQAAHRQRLSLQRLVLEK